MALRIVTDSTADIPLTDQQALNIDILPLKVFFGEEEYIDGVTLTQEEFYQKLSTVEELPKTAQIQPREFEKLFQSYLDAGDEIVCIHLSSKLSGTVQSANIAKTKYKDAPIYIIDSGSVTLSLHVMVRLAIRLRDQGLSAKEIAQQLEASKEKIRLYAVIDDIKYLKMGGRLSGASAFVASVLGIKPLVEIRDGEVVPFGKVRGLANAYRALIEKTMEDGVDESLPFAFGYSLTKERAKELEIAFGDCLSRKTDLMVSIGCVVGTHAGPGCTGIAFFKK